MDKGFKRFGYVKLKKPILKVKLRNCYKWLSDKSHLDFSLCLIVGNFPQTYFLPEFQSFSPLPLPTIFFLFQQGPLTQRGHIPTWYHFYFSSSSSRHRDISGDDNEGHGSASDSSSRHKDISCNENEGHDSNSDIFFVDTEIFLVMIIKDMIVLVIFLVDIQIFQVMVMTTR